MRIFLLFLISFMACKPKEKHVCKTVKTEVIFQIEYRHIVDTLVIIQQYDSFPDPKIDANAPFSIKMGGTEMRPTELFENGKRSDTIYRTTYIYY